MQCFGIVWFKLCHRSGKLCVVTVAKQRANINLFVSFYRYFHIPSEKKDGILRYQKEHFRKRVWKMIHFGVESGRVWWKELDITTDHEIY